MDSFALKELARAVIKTEAEAVASLVSRIDEAFAAACQLILDCRGRIVVLGMGKSGYIAGKIAATLANTGTPTAFATRSRSWTELPNRGLRWVITTRCGAPAR